jgi:serine/threonine protein kinase
MEVVKVVGTPFLPLSRIWCRHEADCLLKLAELGFTHAPKLIRSTDLSLTMEKIEGPSLRGRQPVDEQVFLQVLDVVRHLHTLGFAHGNLRANNILITDSNKVVLIDFETCCRRPNPLFFLAKFTDHVRLRSLWRSRVVKTDEGRMQTTFPKHVTLTMLLATPLTRTVGAVKSLRRRLKRSRETPVQQHDSVSGSEIRDGSSGVPDRGRAAS